MKYRISLIGCDDSTVIIYELYVDQVQLLEDIAEHINKTSIHSCMPKMEIKTFNNKMCSCGHEEYSHDHRGTHCTIEECDCMWFEEQK